MGLVNAVLPLEDLEKETVAWCREMSYLSPLALRLLKSSFNAEEDGLTGLQQLSHDATLLFYMTEEGQEGRNSFQEGRAPTSRSSRDALEPRHESVRLWLMAARPRTLPAAIAPVLVGSAAVVEHFGRAAAAGRIRRGAHRQPLHPDRHQPRQRLLRREAGGRHSRPTRSRAGHGGGPGGPPPRAGRHMDRVRGRGGGRHLPHGGGRSRDARDRSRVDTRRGALHGGPAPLRLRGPRRGLRVHLLRARRGQRLLLRPARGDLGPLGGSLGQRRADLDGDSGRQQRPRHRH